MADSTSQTIFTSDAFTGPAERSFPGGTTYQEFAGQATGSGAFADIEAGLPEKVRLQFLDMALEGGRRDVSGRPIDLNSYFGTPVSTIFRKDMKGLYPAAQQAYKREQDGTATPEDTQLLAQVRDPNGIVMKSITSLSYGHPVLGRGFTDTGSFPRNSLTGELEGLDLIPESIMGEGYEIGPIDLSYSNRDVAITRAEDGEKLLRYVRSMPDLQGNQVIQDAVVQAVEGDIFDVTAERMYNLLAGGDELVRHYLPRFFFWAESNITGFSEPMSEEDIAQDLALVRNSSPFANRQEVLNDLIRDQLMEMGLEDELRQGGYLETQEVDGKTRYTKNFVSKDFAEGFFETLFDTQTFGAKIASIVLENAGGYAAVKAPIQGSFNAQRVVRRHIDNVRGDKVTQTVPGGESKVLGITVKSDPEDVVVGRTNRPSSFTTPDGDFEVAQKFSIASPADQLAMATEYAALKGIPLREAGRQLAMMNNSPRFWNRWSANRIVDRMGIEVSRQAVAAAGAESIPRITELTLKLRNAQLRAADGVTGAADDVLKFSEQLRSERAYANWRKVKAAVPMARAYGINPAFDTFMAFTQVTGREMMGPMGEAVAAGGMIAGMGTLKLFDMSFPKTVPFISGVAARTAFSAKVGIEDSLAFFLEFKGVAARGYAQGWLVNPGLRGLLNAAPEELSGKITAGQMRQLQDFAKRMFAGMSPLQRDTMLDMMDEGFADVEKVLSSFEGLVSYETLQGLRQTLSLNLGQATGLHVFLSLEASSKLNTSGLSPKDVQKFTKRMRGNLDMQYEADQQVGAMATAIEQLDRAILQIEEELTTSGRLLSVEDQRAREFALDSLRQLSGSFKNAETFGKDSIRKMMDSDLDAAGRILSELALESNSKFLEEAFISGQIDSMLEIYARMDQRANVAPDIAPEGAVAPGGVTTSDTALGFPAVTTVPQQLRKEGTNVETALATLRSAIKGAVDKGRVSSSAAERATTQNTTVVNLVELAESTSKLQVDAAYDAIGKDITIPLNVFASDMLEFVKSFATDQRSFIKMIDPARMNMGGSAGEKFVRALNNAARTGLESAIGPRLDDINAELAGSGFQFAGVRDYLNYIKKQIEIDEPTFMQTNGFQSADDISDAQLMFFLIENEDFVGIDVQSLRLMTSAQDLETLRQGANATIRKYGVNDDRSKFAENMRTEIDKTFDTWGQTANLEDYNKVVVARKTHQLERQRFGQGTFGYKVITALGEDRVAEGAIEVGDTTKVSALLAPIARYISNPNSASASDLKGVMDDMLATFAPVTTTMAEQVLVKNADGRYVLPTSEDLAGMSTQVMTEGTFNEMQIIFDVLIRNAVFEQSNMKGVKEALDAGKIPALKEKDAPRRLKVPAGFSDQANPYEAYMEAVQEMFTVQVLDEATGKVVTRKLFNFEDLIMLDRNIVDVVAAVPAYRNAHKDLISVANTQRDLTASAATAAKETQLGNLAEVGKAAQIASGQGFVDGVLKNTDPRAFDLFVNRVESTQKFVGLSAPQKTEGYRALFVETLKAAGGYKRGTRTVTMFDGQKVPGDTYSDPQNVFLLLDDALVSGGSAGSRSVYGASDEGRKLRQLAEKAGVTDEQLETLHAIFRLSTRVEASSLLARQGTNDLKQLTKGFTLDNALSKAFNIARGMVSKEYVAAEVALRYAALTQGKSVDFLLSDPKASGIVYNLLKQDDLVGPEDAEYFATALMKFISADLPATVFQVDVGSDEYAQDYWISQGLMFTPEPNLFEQAVP